MKLKTILFAFVCAAVFFACSSPLDMVQNPKALKAEAGYGKVRIAFAGDNGRTVYPNTAFNSYEYMFTKIVAGSTNQPEAKTPDTYGYFTLEPGTYTVTVVAYMAGVTGAVASGTSDPFTVYADKADTVTLSLTALTKETGNGNFSMSIAYPAEATATVRLEALAAGSFEPFETIEQDWFALNSDEPGTTTGTANNLPAGYYLVTVTLTKEDGTVAGAFEAVHIYGNLTSEWNYTFTNADFAVPPDPITGEIVFELGGSVHRVFQALPPSPYHVELWVDAAGADSAQLTWYGADVKGGAAFKAEWSNVDDFLGRVGYYWGNGGSYLDQENIYVDYNYTRIRQTAQTNDNAGPYSFIGIYGWSRNSAAAPNDLIEYYIVDDWFGNAWYPDTTPNSAPGTQIGSFYVDGALYNIYYNVRPDGSASIRDGGSTAAFAQIYSVRQTLRQSGTISVTEHFKKWAELGYALEDLYECKFLVEAGGGTGWLDLDYLSFVQESVAREVPLPPTQVTGSWNGLTIPSSTTAYELATFEGKDNVLHIAPAGDVYEFCAVNYDISAYIGKTVTVTLSMDVLPATEAKIVWQLFNQDGGYPLVAGSWNNFPAGTWQHISGSYTLSEPLVDRGSFPLLYLSASGSDGQLSTEQLYIANPVLTVTEVTDTYGLQDDGTYTLNPAGFQVWYGATKSRNSVAFTNGGVYYPYPNDFDITRYGSLEIDYEITAYTAAGAKSGVGAALTIKTYSGTLGENNSGTNVKYTNLGSSTGSAILYINDQYNNPSDSTFADRWHGNNDGFAIVINDYDTTDTFTIQFNSITFIQPPPPPPPPPPEPEYVITGSDGAFTATRGDVTDNGYTVVADAAIVDVISAIRTDAAGEDCEIQFGDGDAVLDVGSFGTAARPIAFNTTGGTWGLITLTGKITGAGTSAAVVYVQNDVSINSQADITNTAAYALYSGGIYNAGTGTVTISGGTVLAAQHTVFNNTTGTVNIEGGEISVTNIQGIAVQNNSTGTVNISNGKVSSSTNTSSRAVQNSNAGSVTISGGEVSSTGAGIAVYNNNNAGTVTISGGKVSSVSGDAVYNNGRVTIRGAGTEVSSTNGIAVNNNGGTLNIEDGTISSTSTEGSALKPTVRSFSNSITNITGGTVSATVNPAVGLGSGNPTNALIKIGGTAFVTSASTSFAILVGNNIEISGGTVENTSALGAAISTNRSEGTVIISGGTVSALNAAAVQNSASVTISGTAVVTSANTDTTFSGTISSNPNTAKTKITIEGGTVRNTADGNAVCIRNNTVEANEFEMSGGLVENTAGGEAIYIAQYSTSPVTISGGTVRANTGCAIMNMGDAVITISEEDAATLITSAFNPSSGSYRLGTISVREVGGSLTINGGRIENNSTATRTDNNTIYAGSNTTINGGEIIRSGNSNGNAINTYTDVVLTMTGGTVSKTGTGSGSAINNFNGTVSITGGTVSRTGNAGNYAIYSNNIRVTVSSGATVTGNTYGY